MISKMVIFPLAGMMRYQKSGDKKSAKAASVTNVKKNRCVHIARHFLS